MKRIIYIVCLFFAVGFTSCKDDDSPNIEPLVYPTFSQGSGTFNNPISVEIGSNIENAKIFYTTDGSLPSTSSTVYSAPVIISSDTDLKALAVSEANGVSEIGGVKYTFKTDAPSPSVESGRIDFSQYIKLNSATEDAVIYYTLDGSDPSDEAMLFDPATDSIWVDVNFEALKAIAYRDNFAASDTLSLSYTIRLEEVSSIYWYAFNGDQVPVVGSDPFVPYDEAINNYQLFLNSTQALDTVPLDHDVLVLADTYSGNFDLSDFQGKVIATFNKSIEAFMEDILERETEGEFWEYALSSEINWENPEDWGTEPVTAGTISYLVSEIDNDESVGVSFVKRSDLMHATIATGDAVIVYEVSKGDKKWYWVHIGAVDSSDPQRASEILKFALDTLTGN